VNVKAQVSGRLREVRQELFGDHGGPDLARRLNLPARTWYNYETGVTVPAEVLLGFIDQTGANPRWLLTGEGSRFRHETDDLSLDHLSPSELIRRSLAQLAKETEESDPVYQSQKFTELQVVPLSSLFKQGGDQDFSLGTVMVDRSWIPNPEETLASTIEDDSMAQVLPKGSLVAIDLSVRDPAMLAGRIAAAKTGTKVLIRWLERTDRHVILRSNQPDKHPLLPLNLEKHGSDTLLGQVVWSWTRFSGD
jgi:phage repressor protein C with HTH and peptisase S24 domain